MQRRTGSRRSGWKYTQLVPHVGAAAVLAAASVAACGSSTSSFGTSEDAGPAGATDASEKRDAGVPTLGGDGGHKLGAPAVKSLTVTAASPSIQCKNGASATGAFTADVRYVDGTRATVTTSASWSADQPQLGNIAGAGRFKATGAQGGVVTVTATYEGVSASTTLNVSLLLAQNPASLPSAAQTALASAATADAAVVWAYPYDGTVWPRGLLPPTLQWNGGAATDDYYVDLKSPTFELQLFTTSTGAPASQIALDPTMWQEFTSSTTGAATLTVARWDGTVATQVAKQTWTIASGSMRGTIYYWSNDLGRVLRISPGAATPDDFANQAPLNDPTQFQQNSTGGAGGCLMTCHTVSADGSTLVSGGGVYAGSYDLKTDQPIYSLGGTWDINPNAAGQAVWQNIEWEASALSPDGKYVLTNSMAQSGVTDTGGPDTFMGLFTTADGQPVATSGVTGSAFAAPAWSPEGSRVAFVASGDPTTWTEPGTSWQNPPAAALEVVQFDATKNPMFSAPTALVPVGTGNPITWPSVSPDGKWVIYSRAVSFDTRAGNGDLYLASAVTPGQEVRLAALDGDNYPFAAGARDLSWSFEPSFAPVASGGYFWVVFTSRRTYGNILTGQALPCTTSPCTEVKQLWVAAIDQNPKPGVDPSHAAFHLTGQEESNLAMRGFWALPPCKTDGNSCSTGTDCCGGFCAPEAGDAGISSEDGGVSADGGSPAPTPAAGICRSSSSGCSTDGDRCNTAQDCCSASSGTTCINHVCSEASPRLR